MSSQATCPSDEALARFLDGRLSPPERDGIVDHVDACSQCSLLLAIPEKGSAPAPRSVMADGTLVATFLPGALLAGRYRITRLLGTGGMGEVYEAFDLTLAEPVALKTVRATIADDRRAVERLKSEVLLARRVTHPNVCRIFDFGVHQPDGTEGDPLPFLTMELLRGATLATHVRQREPMSTSRIVDVAQQLAAGLLAAHKVHVIHKDFKAENVILVDAAGEHSPRAVVTDFGLAATRALAEVGGQTLTRFSGTPGYIAPERLRGEPVTEASDVYSLGVVILDMVSGVLPRHGGPERGAVSGNAMLLALARRCQAADPHARPSTGEVLRILHGLQRPDAGGRSRALRWGLGAAALAAGTVVMVMGLGLGRSPAVPDAAAVLPPTTAAAPVAAPPAPAMAAASVPARALAPAAPAPVAGAPPAAPAPVASAPPARQARPRGRTVRAPRVTDVDMLAPAPAPVAMAAPVAPVAPHRPSLLGNEPIRALNAPAREVPRDDAPITTLPHVPAP